MTTSNFFSIINTGYVYADSETNGLRPVFHLRPEVIVTGGSGSEEDPYTLFRTM